MGERLKRYLKNTGELVERLTKEAEEQKEGKEGAETGTAGENEAFRMRLEKEKAELLVQIGFFQHERLIHLIVTVLFALLTIMVYLSAAAELTPWIGALLFLLLVLLIPYIRHYWLLENGTQKLYRYYDKLEELYNRRIGG